MKGHKAKISWRGNGGEGRGRAWVNCECGWAHDASCTSRDIALQYHSNHKWDVREARAIAKELVDRA